MTLQVYMKYFETSNDTAKFTWNILKPVMTLQSLHDITMQIVS